MAVLSIGLIIAGEVVTMIRFQSVHAPMTREAILQRRSRVKLGGVVGSQDNRAGSYPLTLDVDQLQHIFFFG